MSRTLCLLLAITAACARPEPRPEAVHVGTIEGFAQPESASYDSAQDVYFVSSMAGFGSVKDGIGYISRVSADDLRQVDVFIESGKNGAHLDAPKGMALQGDTLWVADIDVLRGFHRRNGAPLATIDLRPYGAVLLNDVALGPGGGLYVTDSGIGMTPFGVEYGNGQKILSVTAPGRTVRSVATGPELGFPNGIDWDARRQRWIVATFHPHRSEAYALEPGSGSRQVLARGSGRFDGIAALHDGRILFTSWSDSSLHLLDSEGDRRIVRDLWQAADLGVDTRRDRVAVPLVLQGRVEVWQIPD